MPTISVEVPDVVYATLNKHVENGTFRDPQDVVSAAIRQFDDRMYQTKLQQLREALAEGIHQANAGETVPYDMQSILDELDREIEA